MPILYIHGLLHGAILALVLIVMWAHLGAKPHKRTKSAVKAEATRQTKKAKP